MLWALALSVADLAAIDAACAHRCTMNVHDQRAMTKCRRELINLLKGHH